MPDWIRAQGSQLHSIFSQLSDANGPLDIPQGTTVEFIGKAMFQREDATPIPDIGSSGVVVRADATADDEDRGFVRYDLSQDDVATPAMYKCVWILTPPNSVPFQAFSEDSDLILWVKEIP